MTLISIIVPVYNVERYINNCIDSILNQTHDELQIILVDDGSEDRSGLICDEYAQKDDRIKVVHQKHMGAANARNTGLYQVQGQYVGFVDADDYCKPEMFEKLLLTVIDDKSDAARCNYWRVKNNKPLLYITNTSHMKMGRNPLYFNIIDPKILC